MTEAHRFIWVQGNHDPTPPQGVGGEWVEAFATTTLVFRHQATPGAQAEISGHHHPKAAMPGARRQRQPPLLRDRLRAA